MVDKSSKLVDKFAVISGTGGSGPGGGPLNLQSGGGGGGSGGGGGVSDLVAYPERLACPPEQE